ncbi:MAG: hypothetical protein RL662_443 [Bacteroidota bacterium]|jgi:hypothetical protein
MAKCNLTASITKTNCEYQVAGVKAVYLFNYDAENTYETDSATGYISDIRLASNAKAYKIDFIEGTASWTDDLAVNGNGGKYRTHTLNFTIGEYDYSVLNEGDALSMGKFTAVVVDKSGRTVCIGRRNGLSATSFNYASGAADADANGWTVVLAGTEMELGQRLTAETAISKNVELAVVTP